MSSANEKTLKIIKNFIFNHRILSKTIERIHGKKFIEVDCIDWKVITFEVKKKLLFVLCLDRDSKL